MGDAELRPAGRARGARHPWCTAIRPRGIRIGHLALRRLQAGDEQAPRRGRRVSRRRRRSRRAGPRRPRAAARRPARRPRTTRRCPLGVAGDRRRACRRPRRAPRCSAASCRSSAVPVLPATTTPGDHASGSGALARTTARMSQLTWRRDAAARGRGPLTGPLRARAGRRA